MASENLHNQDCIRTFTGLYIDVFNPDPELIRIEDIAHSLSQQCRFGGHLPKFYSVAQHCVECCDIVEPKFKMEALMHDASEAYLMDIPRPIKRRLANYKDIEDNLMKVIAAKFGFKFPFRKEVKNADEIMLETEWKTIMLECDHDIIILPSNLAKKQFLKLFFELV